MDRKTRHKKLFLVLKISISLLIVGYLVWNAQKDKAFQTLWEGKKNWPFLGSAVCLISFATLLTFFRWYFLIRALRLSFRLKDALRLSFLGYLLNFVSLGSVGGDFFKAIFIAREQPGRRAEAISTVLLDRIIGLYALFLVASIAVFRNDLLNSPLAEVRVICQGTLVGALFGTVGLVLLLLPGFTTGTTVEWMEKAPKLGPFLHQVMQAVRLYRKRLPTIINSILLSMIVHIISTLGIYSIALGLPGESPSLGSHFVSVPLAMVAGALPLPLNGLGAFEGVIEFLYTRMPGDVIPSGQGLLVALAYRLITILLAAVSAVMYLTSRKDVETMMHEAERLREQSL